MNLALIEYALKYHTDLLEFLKNVILGFNLSKETTKQVLKILKQLPLKKIQTLLENYYEKSFIELPTLGPGINKNMPFPENGMAGIFFDMGGDNYCLDIAGSIYFDEPDWIPYADYNSNVSSTLTQFSRDFHKIREEIAVPLEDILESEDEEKNNDAIWEDSFQKFMFSLIAFTLVNFLKNFPQEIARKYYKNTGVALGFTNWPPEIILGVFNDGKFVINLRDTEKTGYTKEETLKPEINKYEQSDFIKQFKIFISDHPESAQVYDYICFNYHSLMDESAKKLVESQEAFNQFLQENNIILNRCKKCNHYKKTPRARLCLNCGDFSKTELTIIQ